MEGARARRLTPRGLGLGPQPQRIREHSIEAKPDWEELDEIAFPRLASLQIEPPEAEDLYAHASELVTFCARPA